MVTHHYSVNRSIIIGAKKESLYGEKMETKYLKWLEGKLKSHLKNTQLWKDLQRTTDLKEKVLKMMFVEQVANPPDIVLPWWVINREFWPWKRHKVDFNTEPWTFWVNAYFLLKEYIIQYEPKLDDMLFEFLQLHDGQYYLLAKEWANEIMNNEKLRTQVEQIVNRRIISDGLFSIYTGLEKYISPGLHMTVIELEKSLFPEEYDLLIISVHLGTDMRWGYSSPHVFIGHTDMILSDSFILQLPSSGKQLVISGTSLEDPKGDFDDYLIAENDELYEKINNKKGQKIDLIKHVIL